MIVKNIIRTCQFDGEVDSHYLDYIDCCESFEKIDLDKKYRPSKLYTNGEILNFCPYCGEKIEYIVDKSYTVWG